MTLKSGATREARRSRICSLALLWACASAPAMAIEVTIPLPKFGPDNYAECVIDKIEPDIGPVETQSIKSNCRSDFPKASSRGLFGPRSAQSCYNKNEYRVAHREAAEAVYDACQDYFRSTAANNSALRGGRLQ